MIASALGGLVASFVMIFVMFVITRSGIANGDMVRAIGGLITKRYENCFSVGLIVYCTVGIVFGIFYRSVLLSLPIESPAIVVLMGAFAGMIHGIIVGFALVIEIAGRHPLAQFRKAGFSVALAHIVGHISFGASMGLFTSIWSGNGGLLVDQVSASNGALYLLTLATVGTTVLVVTGLTRPNRGQTLSSDEESAKKQPA